MILIVEGFINEYDIDWCDRLFLVYLFLFSYFCENM